MFLIANFLLSKCLESKVMNLEYKFAYLNSN
jgi:hypothetical protein